MSVLVSGETLQDILPLCREGDKLECVWSAKTSTFTRGRAYIVQKNQRGNLYIPCDKGVGQTTSISEFKRVKAEAPSDRSKGKIASDGSSSDYYKLPDHAKELGHLIDHKGMSFNRGNIFKACYRLGEKEGVDLLYDLNKIKFFAERLIEQYHRGEHI
jgi:hypothetical protein